MTLQMTLTLQEAAQTALAVQDACNLSGVLRSFNEIVQEVIWPEARKQGKGTEFVNTHPIVTLFLSKLCSLNQHDADLDADAFSMAYDAVKLLANEKPLSWKEVQS